MVDRTERNVNNNARANQQYWRQRKLSSAEVYYAWREWRCWICMYDAEMCMLPLLPLRSAVIVPTGEVLANQKNGRWMRQSAAVRAGRADCARKFKNAGAPAPWRARTHGTGASQSERPAERGREVPETNSDYMYML
jgi:hypothetical protein